MLDIFSKVLDYWTPAPLTSMPPGRNLLADLNEADGTIQKQEVEIAQLKVIIDKMETTYAQVGELYLTSMREAMETIIIQVDLMQLLAAEVEALKNPPAPAAPEYHLCDLSKMEKKDLSYVMAELGLASKFRETKSSMIHRIEGELDLHEEKVVRDNEGLLHVVPVSE